LDSCFVEDYKPVKSLAECFDWSTVEIDGHEEVDTIRQCVDNSFETPGDKESTNKLLKEDYDWAKKLDLKFHPSIVINDKVYKGDIKGKELAQGICEAF